MTDFERRFQELEEKQHRKVRLQAMLAELYRQKQETEQNERKLQDSLAKEQQDVTRLEENHFVSFFYQMLGKKEEKLDEERAQAHEAAAKHQSAIMQLTAICQDIQRYEAEMCDLQHCERDYQKLMQEKQEWLMREYPAIGEQLVQKQRQIAALKGQHKEIGEAQSAGQHVQKTIADILEALDSAHGWAEFDVWGNGGIITTYQKHNHLDHAQEMLHGLQNDLRNFQTELADVNKSIDFEVQIIGFLRFADYFFDSFFVDLSVLDRIDHSLEKVSEVRKQVSQVMYHLAQEKQEIEQQLADTQAMLQEFIRIANG